MKFLVVIDMQNDFVDGALGTAEAVAVVDNVVKEIQCWAGPVICTRDTHGPRYLDSQEGRKLPVVHCVKGTDGWQLNPQVQAAAEAAGAVLLDKPSFGSTDLPFVIRQIVAAHATDDRTLDSMIDRIELIGICTDICVISNAMILKAAFPEVPISVKASCCAGVTPEQHDTALAAMRPCQIDIL
ncbi:MAG: cysteine hydrolase [Mogibacterium sp.]|nr:cysteine hydrolase [Mogibacterium sp.]